MRTLKFLPFLLAIVLACGTVFGQDDLPTSGTGYINNVSQARVGPNQVAGSGGYDGIQFDPPAPGTYYIEFNRVNSSSGSTNPGSFFLNYFDLCIYNTVDAEVKKGRLHSKDWQFWDALDYGFNFQVNSSTFYIYSTDSVVTSVEYDEKQ